MISHMLENWTSGTYCDDELRLMAIENCEKAQDPVEKVRLCCLIRGAAGIKGLARIFNGADTDNNNRLNLKEFLKGFHDYGVPLSDSDITKSFIAIDTNEDGTIDFDEFVLALRSPMSSMRENLIETAFRKIDTNNDGKITIADLEAGFDVSNHPRFVSGQKTKQQLFDMFVKQFDIDEHEESNITKDEFFNYYSGVSASVDSDRCFEAMMRNTWNI